MCDALLDRRDGAQVLRALEQANLFINPLDHSGVWYRYHHLFGDLLRHRLEITLPAEMRTLHERASRWFGANGYAEEAVRHALAAHDWQTVGDLLQSDLSNRLLAQGRMVTLLRWYDALPQEFVRANPRLCMERTWPLILTDQLDAAEPYLDIAEQSTEQSAEGTDDGQLSGGIAVARAFIARARGEHAKAVAFSVRALALLPEEDASSRSVVAVNLGIAQYFAGRLGDAEQALRHAEATGRRSGNDYARFAALAFLGRVQRARGHLHQHAAMC